MKKFLLTLICLGMMLPFAFAQAATIDRSLPQAYAQGEKIKVLVVPGHDKDFSGAVYNGVKEADMNVALGEQLVQALEEDRQIDATLARTSRGYDSALQKFFNRNKKSVQRFIETHKKTYAKAVKRGDIIIPDVQVTHGDAPSEAAYRLYGINKWIKTQDYDVVIHIHFNDYGGRKGNQPGLYDGFAIYVPGEGMPNAERTMPIASAIGASLLDEQHVSTMPGEGQKADKNGLIPDLKLIALGSYGTLDVPSMLIEYAYMYEPQVSPATFPSTSALYAQATADGLVNYLSQDK